MRESSSTWFLRNSGKCAVKQRVNLARTSGDASSSRVSAELFQALPETVGY